MSVVGDNLARVLHERERHGRKLTKAKLAGDVFGHNTGSYISAIVAGRKHPSDEAIAKLETYLELSPGTLKQGRTPLRKKPGELPGT